MQATSSVEPNLPECGWNSKMRHEEQSQEGLENEDRNQVESEDAQSGDKSCANDCDSDPQDQTQSSSSSSLTHGKSKSADVDTLNSVQKRTLPTWMLKKPNLSENSKSKELEVKGRQTRSLVGHSKTPVKARHKRENTSDFSNESDDAGEQEEEEEEEFEPRAPARSKPTERSFRQRRAAAVKVGSYAEKEFVLNDSEFSESSEDEARHKKRYGKYESDEEYQEETNNQNDSGSDYGASAKKAGPKRGGAKTRASKRRRSSHVASDDDFIDDEEASEEEYHPRPSKSRRRASPKKSSGRQACVYGVKCYRKNVSHKKDYSHPGDSDWSDEDSSKNSAKPGKRKVVMSDSEEEEAPNSDYGSSDEDKKRKKKRK